MKPVSRETTTVVSLDSILTVIAKSDPIQWFLSPRQKNSSRELSDLTTPALLLVLASYFRSVSKPVVVIAPDSQSSEKLYKEAFNLLGKQCFYLAQIQEEDRRVPGFEIEPERYLTEALHALGKKTFGLFFTTPDALRQSILPPSNTSREAVVLKVNSTFNREQLIKTLLRWNYELMDFCITPKSFSSRGGILDIFLPYASHPVRLEFFGNSIESIRLFDPSTQRSIGDRVLVELLPPPVMENATDTITVLRTIEGLNCVILYIIQKDNNFSLANHPHPKKSRSIHQEEFFLLQHTVEARNEILTRALTGYGLNQRRFYFDPRTHEKPFPFSGFKHVLTTLPAGFHSKDLGVICLTPREIGRAKPRLRTRWAIKSPVLKHEKLSSLKSLDWGDYLVHQDYGIGLYRGLAKVGDKNALQENIKIEYEGGFVYIPIDSFTKVHRYIGLGDGTPKLSRLGSGQWERQKAVTRKSAQAVVDMLVALYRARSQPRGFTYSADTEFLVALEESFPYEETHDQEAAIRTVLEDMDRLVPMDRLIYGDVGFGKTEVALRAAVKAITSGKMVFFLTPTTILADQHYITSKNRLQPLGITVELLSRFRSKKEQAEIIQKIKDHKIDLLVGTHRLLSGDLDISNLGLLILDEEHRFGVKHKETIRQLKTKVDVLTLTATPIPRTLQQSLVGIKAISKIETAPKERLPISTWVKYFDWNQIYQMIDQELGRGGQVYFLHNDIESMAFYFNKIEEQFPDRRIAMAHGKMTSRELERTILSFFSGEIDVLICTTIIESGLDVSSANTIIINNAHRFGLAQLYQIRGRVGRSEQQAYCYLLIPKDKSLSPEAYQRLKAIEYYSTLGSGYNIALKDLEIRGAGNLFGFEQSGHISKVGFEMYSKIIKDAVDETLNKTVEPKRTGPYCICRPCLYTARIYSTSAGAAFFLSAAGRGRDG
jgi:transcription-repair coupling factor (superfamily II helicase)